MSYLQKYVFWKKRNSIHIKGFNMITNEKEAKTMAKHISCDSKCKFNSTTCKIQMKNGIIKHVNVSVKIIVHAKKITVGILARAFVRIISI